MIRQIAVSLRPPLLIVIASPDLSGRGNLWGLQGLFRSVSEESRSS
jgi:hypothetical protein